MKVKLYTMDKCQACGLIKSLLDDENIDYELINISDNKEALKYFKQQNYKYLPVVEVFNDDHLQAVCVGYQPDDLMEMIGRG